MILGEYSDSTSAGNPPLSINTRKARSRSGPEPAPGATGFLHALPEPSLAQGQVVFPRFQVDGDVFAPGPADDGVRRAVLPRRWKRRLALRYAASPLLRVRRCGFGSSFRQSIPPSSVGIDCRNDGGGQFRAGRIFSTTPIKERLRRRVLLSDRLPALPSVIRPSRRTGMEEILIHQGSIRNSVIKSSY